MSRPNSPIVNAGLMYVNCLDSHNLVIPSVPVSPYVAGKALVLEPGQARDSTNTNDIVLDQALDANRNPIVLNGIKVGAVINGLQVGANGVDQRFSPSVVLAPSSLYAVYVIGSSRNEDSTLEQVGGGPLNFLPPNPPSPPFAIPSPFPVNSFPGAGLLSLAACCDAPALPIDYDMYRRIGWVSTDSSSLLLNFWQVGCDEDRPYWYDVPRPLATTAASATYAPLALRNPSSPNQAYVPVCGCGVVYLNVDFVPTAPGDVVSFLPYGSASTGAGAVQLGASGSVAVPYCIDTVDFAGVPTGVVLYKTAATVGSLSISVAGFADSLCCDC